MQLMLVGPGRKWTRGTKGTNGRGISRRRTRRREVTPAPYLGAVASAKGLAVHLTSRKHISEDKMKPCAVCADNVELSSKKRGQKITPPSLREHTRQNHKKVASVSPKPPAKKKPNRSGLTEHLSQKDLESDIRRMNNILMKHL